MKLWTNMPSTLRIWFWISLDTIATLHKTSPWQQQLPYRGRRVKNKIKIISAWKEKKNHSRMFWRAACVRAYVLPGHRHQLRNEVHPPHRHSGHGHKRCGEQRVGILSHATILQFMCFQIHHPMRPFQTAFKDNVPVQDGAALTPLTRKRLALHTGPNSYSDTT